MYAGDEDWVLTNENNMRAYCRTELDSRLRFMAWDADSTFASGWNNDSVDFVFFVSNPEHLNPFQALFDSLNRNRDFRDLFASRLRRWSVDGGPLSSSAARQRYEHLLTAIEPALIAEAARWGDVHNDEPSTHIGHWVNQKQRILREWFPNRSELVLKELHEYWSD